MQELSETRIETAETVIAELADAAGVGPAFLHLLVADRCNHACTHCYQVQGLKGEMAFADIVGILRKFREAGGFVVSVSGGEATLRSDLVEILQIAREFGLATVLLTNAYLVDSELAAKLAATGVWRVEVSLYSDVASEHDAATAVPGSWERTLAGIRHLRANGVNVRIKYTETRSSTATTERLIALCRELGSELRVAEHVTAGEAGKLEPMAARQDAHSVASRHAREPRAVTLQHAPCGIGTGITVRSDGVLTPCTNVMVELGRLETTSDLRDFSRDSESASFFRSLTWGDIHGCRDCDLRSRCTRCYASAAAESGDMLAPYRGACELAVARHAQAHANLDFLPASPGCGPDRDPSVGPYRVEESGALRPIPDVVAQEDDARALRYPWIRPTKMMLADQSRSAIRAVNDLVQLRVSKRGDTLDPCHTGG